MGFKHFFTWQRFIILLIGSVLFAVCLFLAHHYGHLTQAGSLMIDLAGSTVTVVFTALVIEYLQFKERASQTRNAAGIAEDEIQAICLRVRWSMAGLYGYETDRATQDKLAGRADVKRFLDQTSRALDDYLERLDFASRAVKAGDVPAYRDTLRRLQTEVGEALILYEYALSLSLRERVLTLRSELQVTERMLEFIDTENGLSQANIRLLAATSEALCDATRDVLDHESRAARGRSLDEKPGRVSKQA